MNRIVMMVGSAVFLIGAPAARAQAPDLSKQCSGEIAKYCPTAKSNDEIMECIEKREQMGKKKSGLSHKCYEAHEKLESPESEKREKNEKHE
ncbi:MAG: hypothetical protein LC659_00890 [Myxococcales bacterium]|nr:hypothetical protein [Myxococcales bacterium]